MSQQHWPEQIWIVRHGQSAGNVAREAAEAAGVEWIDIATRDVDVPLSALGERQSVALGHWFARMPSPQRPSVVLCSPYLRTRKTAELVLETARLQRDSTIFLADERLREKEFGILDRLTRHGIRGRHASLNAQRQHVGKFYFRPPGGESWCDVILRLRSMCDSLAREYCEERVLIVAHQVIVNCFRYLFEHLDEQQVLAIDRRGDVPNCSVTSYTFDPAHGRQGLLLPELVNFVAPLEQENTPVTAGPDLPAAPQP